MPEKLTRGHLGSRSILDEGLGGMRASVIRSLMSVTLAAAVGAAAATEGRRHPFEVITFEHGRDCPSLSSREAATVFGQRAVEGHTVLLDADSHPRKPAKLLEGPTVRRKGGGWLVSFALDTADDVLVRVVDGQGKGVRTLACGVMGSNAPDPFEKGSLKQEIEWDGKDAAGKPAPEGCLVQVGVGLKPRFERFVCHDPGQLTNLICGLEVDPQGRLYVALHTEQEGDPNLLRFDRQGRYLNMAYPSSPRAVPGRLESAYEHTEYIDGRAVPTRRVSWPFWIDRKFQDILVFFPFRIDRQGRGWFAEINTGYGSFYCHDEDLSCRVFPVPDLDRFFLMQNVNMYPWSTAFAASVDGKGFLATSAGWSHRFVWPPFSASLNDPQAAGTIRAIDLATGRLVPYFNWGEGKYTPYGGISQVIHHRHKMLDRTEPNPDFDAPDRFIGIQDMQVDAAGRLLVIDGYPRRIKIYAKSACKWPESGQYLGEIQALTVAGKLRRFADLRSIRVAGDALYLVTSFRDAEMRGMHVVKCVGDYTKAREASGSRAGVWIQEKLVEGMRAAWTVKLDDLARFVAVDEQASPQLVWVGNGNGPATITRIEDLGERCREVRQVGGIGPRTLPHPIAVAALNEGELFVYDHELSRIVRTGDDGSGWRDVDVPKPPDPYHNALPLLTLDRSRGVLFVSWVHEWQGKNTTAEQQLQCFDLGLEPIECPLKPWAEGAPKGKLHWAGRHPGIIAGPDSGGRLYSSNGKWVRQYAPDGSVANPELVQLFVGGAGLALDSKGCIYAFDQISVGGWHAHNFPVSFQCGPSHYKRLELRRGSRPMWHLSEFTYLVKFGPNGGKRATEAELWAHRGVSPCGGGGYCACNWPRQTLAIDGADRIFALDHGHFHVKALDTAGNLICRIGWWGNAETVPGPEGDATQLGFASPYCLSAAGDVLYVSDKDLRRIAKFRMEYRELKTARLP